MATERWNRVTVLFQLVVDARGRLTGLQIPKRSSEASIRLLTRIIKKGVVRSVVVHRVQPMSSLEFWP